MVLAFEKLSTIQHTSGITEQQRLWLEDYDGLTYSKALNKVHYVKWATKPEYYDKEKFSAEINCIGRKKDRLVIEFDGEPEKAKQDFETTKQKLISLGYGFIHSTHGSLKSDYLWVEFDRDLTTQEAQDFLCWIAPKGSEVDLNFTSDKKVFPVLFAPHWKYSGQVRELPVEYFEGNKIPFDNLNIPQQKISQVTKQSSDGFYYETYVKPDKKSVAQYKTNLEVLTYADLKKFKANKNYLIENFLYPGSVNMIYSPPAHFKSLLSAGLAFSVSNGVDFLGMKTKKCGVLYLDGENSQSIMKERAIQIHKGFRLKRNKFPLYWLQGGLLMDSKKNINLPYLVEIEELIKNKKKKIKVLIFDTLHRYCLYDENSSDDLNKLYTQVFKPLAEKLGVAVVFLHHSTKNGGYRGSGDFLGMVDVSYRVERKGKTGEFTIINEKCRSGEIPEIKGEIVFGEDYIRFNKLNVIEDIKEKTNKLIEATQRIEELFDETSRLTRKDVISFLEMQNFEYGSVKTIDRALKFLVEQKKVLDRDQKGVYNLI